MSFLGKPLPFRRLLAGVFLLHLAAFSAFAQRGDGFNSIGSTTDTTRSYTSRSGLPIVVVTVYGKDGKTRLDRQAVVRATNLSVNTVNWRATDDRSEAPMELQFGKYEFEISAVGYLTEKKTLEIITAQSTIRIEVSLHPDPAAVDLNVAERTMPSKARRDVKQAVSALKSGNLKDARKRLDAADKLAPSNPDLSYLLGYLSYEEKDLPAARTYLANAARMNPRHTQAMILLGRVELFQQDYPAAAATLEQAIAVDPDSWIAHHYLADAYLKQKNFAKAREQSELALAKGKGDAAIAYLTLGQALVNLQKDAEGIQALETFTREVPKNPAVPQVRDLIANVVARDADSRQNTASARKNAPPLAGVDSLIAAPDLSLSVKAWQPPGIDYLRPSVATGVACPAADVIEKAGERVKDLVDDVSRIAAIEHLLHQQVDEMGNPSTRETRSYNYSASITEDKPGFFAVDEDRSELLTRADFPDGIASGGFTSLALVFHPDMRDNYTMECEGLGRWHDQATWLVHFRQRDDKPARIHDYRVGGDSYSLRLKGRAWITADKFQIVRIESELVDPMPQIQLRNEQQVVEYGPIQFHGKSVEMWLPQKAEVYLDFRKHRYYRSHSFDHYMLFSVDSEEKRKEPTLPTDPDAQKPLPN